MLLTIKRLLQITIKTSARRVGFYDSNDKSVKALQNPLLKEALEYLKVLCRNKMYFIWGNDYFYLFLKKHRDT